MILAGDIVEYGLNSYGTEVQTWRVQSYMKAEVADEDFIRGCCDGTALSEIMTEMLVEEYHAELTARKASGSAELKRIKLVYCLPEEAEYLSLTGVCGAIAPISECKKIGVVGWDNERIDNERDKALKRAGNGTSHYYRWVK